MHTSERVKEKARILGVLLKDGGILAMKTTMIAPAVLAFQLLPLLNFDYIYTLRQM